MNEHMDERDCINIGYITAPLEYNDELPDYTVDEVDGVKTYAIYRQPNGYPPTFVVANSYSDNEFLGWYDKNQNLYSTNKELSDREMDLDFQKGDHIYAAFTLRKVPSDKKYTIQINSRSDNGLLGGLIGFAPGNLQSVKQTIVVNDGDKVTIYAEGRSGNNDSDFGEQPWWYYIKGIYLENSTPLQTYNDINKMTAQYSFIARSNRTIFIDFVYHKR